MSKDQHWRQIACWNGSFDFSQNWDGSVIRQLLQTGILQALTQQCITKPRCLMKKTILAISLLILIFPVYAGPKAAAPHFVAPKKADAEKWLTDFRAARDKTQDALFLNDEVKRRLHEQVLISLEDRAEKIFGDVFSQYGDCTKAAMSANGYWADVISLMRSPSNHPNMEISSIVAMAWEGGQVYASCREKIDAMK
ncbi:MAG: hypothetical protein ACOYMG_29175 [Candidatus Methylumidiphilus sp.]